MCVQAQDQRSTAKAYTFFMAFGSIRSTDSLDENKTLAVGALFERIFAPVHEGTRKLLFGGAEGSLPTSPSLTLHIHHPRRNDCMRGTRFFFGLVQCHPKCYPRFPHMRDPDSAAVM